MQSKEIIYATDQFEHNMTTFIIFFLLKSKIRYSIVNEVLVIVVTVSSWKGDKVG